MFRNGSSNKSIRYKAEAFAVILVLIDELNTRGIDDVELLIDIFHSFALLRCTKDFDFIRQAKVVALNVLGTRV